MKAVLIVALACVFVGVAVAQGCGTANLPKCKGPVRAAYNNANCDKDPIAYAQLKPDNYEGGKCMAIGPNKYDGSYKGSCGTKLVTKSWETNNCDGPYSYGSAPVGKCFKDELTGLSHKYKCASASTATFSAALVALLALFALLF